MPRYRRALLSALLSITLPAANAASPCPGGLYGLVASGLAQYKPAQTFCSSKYPLPVVTSTVTAPISTKTTTIAIVTTTTTVGTGTFT
jgi:hypothetical protein